MHIPIDGQTIGGTVLGLVGTVGKAIERTREVVSSLPAAIIETQQVKLGLFVPHILPNVGAMLRARDRGKGMYLPAYIYEVLELLHQQPRREWVNNFWETLFPPPSR